MRKKAVFLISAFLLAALASLVLGALVFLNPILNSPFFKSRLNAFLKKKEVRVSYERLNISLFAQSLKAKNLEVSVKNDLSLKISSLKIENAFSGKRSIVAEGGFIRVRLPRKKGKAKAKTSIPSFSSVRIKQISVFLNQNKILIKSLEALPNKKSRFEIEINKSRLSGESFAKGKSIFLVLKGVSLRRADILPLIKAVKPDFKFGLLEDFSFISADKLLVKIAPPQVSIKIFAPVGLRKDKKTFTVDTGRIDVTLEPKGIDVAGEEIKTQANTVKVVLFTLAPREKTIKEIFRIVKKAEIQQAGFLVKIKKKPKKRTHVVFVKAQVLNAEAIIPEVNFPVKDLFASFLFEKNKLAIEISRAKVFGLSVSSSKVLLDFSKKPLWIDVKAQIFGKPENILKTVLKLPVSEQTKSAVSAFRVRGPVSAVSLNLKIRRKIDIQASLRSREIFVLIPGLSSEVRLEKTQVLFRQGKLKILAARFLSEPLRGSGLSLEVQGRRIKLRILKSNFSVESVRKEKIFSEILARIPVIKIETGRVSASDFTVVVENSEVKSVSGILSFSGGVRFKKEILKGLKNFEVKKSQIRLELPLEVTVAKAEIVVNKSLVRVSSLKVDLKEKTLSFEIKTKTSKLTNRILEESSLLPRKTSLIEESTLGVRGKIFLAEDRRYFDVLLERGSETLELSVKLKSGLAEVSVRSAETNLEAEFSGKNQIYLIKLKGRLSARDIGKFIVVSQKALRKGVIEADIEIRFNPRSPFLSEAVGFLRLSGVSVNSLDLGIYLLGVGKTLQIKELSISSPWGSVYGLGSLALKKKAVLDLDLYGSHLDLKSIVQNLPRGESNAKPIPLIIKASYYVSSVEINGFELEDLVGKIHADLEEKTVQINVDNTKLCGIELKASYSKKGEKVSILVESKGKSKFEKTLSCLSAGPKPKGIITGKFKYKLFLKASGKKNPISENSEGSFRIKSKKGRIYKATLIAKILEFLWVKNLVTFNISEFKKAGFPYNKLIIQGTIKNGTAFFRESYIDSPAMKIFFEGRWNFVKDKLNIDVLVAPFKTIDVILSKIPILGRILTGRSKTFISIPVKVTGSLSNPAVVPIPPTAIGSGLIGVVKRTLKTPFEILTIPSSENKTGKNAP